ncbi:MAG TPA: peptidyl-prolyl cis-trans isomerase [Candidatus Dormibacteraeota bacterium]|jgi:peptidyl-prolyl cis-trans isomerase D|nr:peptidyl-prolyl cis-trans isomerase [Candidatus Dormibacteraeota bacterium]
MAGLFENKQVLTRIFIGIFVGLIAVSMLLYLVPQGPGAGASSSDTVATVGGQSISLQDVQQQLTQIEQRGQVPKPLEALYARQILNQLVFDKEIQYEADRLGMPVTNDEMSSLIKQLLPTAFNGDSPVGMDQYSAQVQQRFQMTVPAFEAAIKRELLVEKFRKLVTDGISASPAELKDQFSYQNEKVKLDYALIKPDDLEAKITPDEAELKAYYEKNKTKYQEPERRAVRYGLIDVNRLKQSAQVSDDDLNKLYNQNKSQFQVPERVHVEHILLFTRGKTTEAEIAEVQKRAEDVLKEVKKGGKFEDLAKKYSEDTQTKDKGGDLGWILRGQTVAAFEKAAFGTPKGATSDVVKTEYGFHILKVLDKETPHAVPFEEVKPQLMVNAKAQKGDAEASALADKVSAEIRKSNKTSLDDLAKQFNLDVAETAPVSATDPLLYFGNAPSVKDELFRLRQGEVSMPLRTDRGYVVLTLKSVVPPHPGTFEEERNRVTADVKREKAVQLAKSKADELQKRVKGGEKFDSATKALGLEGKTSDLFARSGSIAGVGSGKQLAAAFQMKVGDVAPTLQLGSNWLMYRVAEKSEPNPGDFEKQKKDLTEQVLQEKRSLAFESFRTALEDRLKKEGKLKIMQDKLKGFGDLG